MSVLDQVFQQILFFVLVIAILLVGMNVLASTNNEKTLLGESVWWVAALGYESPPGLLSLFI